ncbi:DUF2092 domain-containing protein [Caulobacter sp. Root487D2Y]|uniref:DUF2092 domain-containing protein n=1 Tax=Caulobacter sp. Root487D2Y TaxID=1736547 RepID=UPI000B1AC14C|nr:DUF2092 domain-containing protein [Caulobacter sp. Root487D2Y]
MRPLPLVACCVLSVAAAATFPSLALAQTAPAASTAPATAPGEGLVAPIVEPEARQALERMSAYLGTLKTFEIRTQTSLDIVTETGQRVQIDGTAHYKVRKPDGFVIEVVTDLKKRTFFYDGEKFTVFSPEHEFYSTVEAPPTTLKVLDLLWDQYGLALPLEDLFRWNELKSRRPDELTGAFLVGPATIDGVLTNQYAFRQGDVDWSVWIEQGARPLPRKLMIVDRSQPEQPAYVARLTWTLNPTFPADAFTFHAGPKAKSIRMSTLDPTGSTP